MATDAYDDLKQRLSDDLVRSSVHRMALLIPAPNRPGAAATECWSSALDLFAYLECKHLLGPQDLTTLKSLLMAIRELRLVQDLVEPYERALQTAAHPTDDADAYAAIKAVLASELDVAVWKKSIPALLPDPLRPPPDEIERWASPQDLFAYLERKDALGPRKLDLLKSLLKQTGETQLARDTIDPYLQSRS